MPSGLFKFAVSTVFAAAASAFAHPGMPAGHPEVAHPNRTLFELIAADIAVHRGDTGFAYEAWMDAAKNEKSADLAKLAWEAAVATRNPEKAIAAAKVWLDSDPAAFEARLTLLADAVERGDEAAVRAQIDELSRRSSETEKTPAERGSWLVRLYPGLAAVKPGSGLKTAVQTLEPFVAQYPKRADVQIGFAQLLARTGQGDLACRRAAAASAAVPNDHERLGEAADVCWQAGNMGEARSMLEKYLKKHPNDSYVLLIFGRVEERLGRRASALDALVRAMKQPASDERIAFNAGELAADLGDAPKTEAYFKRYVEMLRAQSEDIDLTRLEVWLRLGNAALMQKSPERAAEYYAELRGGPFAVDARIREALALTDAGRPEDALKALREGREELKLDAPALMSAESKLLLELNRKQEAVALMKQAAQTYPTEPEVLYDAAMVEMDSGLRTEAEKHLRALMTVNPQHIQGANALGYLLTEDNRDLKFARELLERAYRAEPLNPYILDSMGWLNFREGRYRAAAEFTTASLKRLWDIEVAGHLVEIYVAQGKKTEALRTLHELARQGGDDAKALVDQLAARWKLSELPIKTAQ